MSTEDVEEGPALLRGPTGGRGGCNTRSDFNVGCRTSAV